MLLTLHKNGVLNAHTFAQEMYYLFVPICVSIYI